MAVYRQIHITYWQDKFVLKLTPEEKFFYLYLLTNSKTKQCGIYELPLEIIQVETGYNRETVLRLLQRFIDHKKISYDWEHEEIFLLNWLKHNPARNPNIQKCIKEELKSVHNIGMIPENSPLRDFLTACKPLASPLQAHLQKEKEKEKEKEEEEEKTVQSLWISTYGINPDPVKEKFGLTLIQKFGYDKAKRILWTLNKHNFRNVAKMESIISESGEVVLDDFAPKKRPESKMSAELQKVSAKLRGGQ